MVEFLLFCIATVGMTSIITQGVIFQPFRQFFGDWAERIREQRERKAQERGGVSLPVPRRSCIEWFSELINCAQCTGFWCGLFCGLMIYFDVENLFNLYIYATVFCCGLGGSFLASLGSNLIDLIFYRKMNALRQLEEQDMILAERHGNREQT
jgi:hypothetical protein